MTLHLICPRCRRLDPTTGQLLTAHITLPDSHTPATLFTDALQHATHLRCSNPHCHTAYPVIDGIPLVFAKANALDVTDISGDPFALHVDTLCAALEGRPPSDPLCALFGRVARHLGSALPDAAAPLHEVHATQVAARLAPHETDEPERVSLGAGVGTEVCAARGGRTTLFDAHLPTLRASKRLLSEGSVTLPVPTSALSWRPHTFALSEALTHPTAHLCSNALDPPFEAERFDTVLALNLLDSITEPYILLGQAHALLRPGGLLALSSPFTWSDAVTPLEHRLEALPMRRDLTPDAVLQQLCQQLDPPLELLERFDSLWHHQSRPRERVIYESAVFLWRKPA